LAVGRFIFYSIRDSFNLKWSIIKTSSFFIKFVPIKKIIAISFFLGCFLSIVKAQTDFLAIQKHVQVTPDSVERDIKKLVTYLVIPTKNDSQKVVSLYQWLIRNISYDRHAYRNGNKRINRSNADILKRKEAICWGYSTLFKAMCDAANIPCEVISGYGKTFLDAKPQLKSSNHAWNSVKIGSTWYLLDATWGSNLVGSVGDFEQKFGYDYFLTPPNYFIINHLPENPDWQLLACPISIADYQLPIDTIIILANRKDCVTWKKEIEREKLSIHDKRLITAIKAYEYNPTKENRRELAFAQLDYEAYLTDISERLQVEQKFDSLLIVQTEMIRLCETATQLAELYDTQLENCAYNFFNYAVTLTQVVANDTNSDLQKWQAVLQYLEKAQSQLKNLPKNIFTENTLTRCIEYIAYAKETIETLK